jgi:hypothetical protein
MRFETVFTIKKAKGCCPAVEEVVKLNCCSGTPIQDLFWRDVRRILKSRAKVHPLVMKWVEGKGDLGIRVDVYKIVPQRYWRYGKRL